jgi:hypothetical protein
VANVWGQGIKGYVGNRKADIQCAGPLALFFQRSISTSPRTNRFGTSCPTRWKITSDVIRCICCPTGSTVEQATP